MSVKIDLTGKRFGRLTVMELEKDIPGKKKKWLCKCDCGNEVIVQGSNLQSGHSSQCKYCQLKDTHAKQITHRMTGTKIYGVWNTMINRCENPNSKSYRDYGEKGVSVCDEWHNSKSFIEWALQNGYREGLEIDRIDTHGNYEPENCRWVSRLENSNNKTNNKIILHNGESKTLAEWARYYGVNYANLSRNIIKGYSLEEAVKREKTGDRTRRKAKAENAEDQRGGLFEEE